MARVRIGLREERRLGVVPRGVWLVLVAGLALQGAWQLSQPPPEAAASHLPPPPAPGILRIAALGDGVIASRLVMLWLQAFDNQPGVSLPFQELDYPRVTRWLDRVLELDPRSRYPLLAAARVYGSVADPARQRVMFEWVHGRFLEDPDERWPWLAHAAIVSRHQLRDQEMALRFAQAITEHATGPEVPGWARDMSVVILSDLGELEAAKVLIGGLLASGRITDEHEIRFLVGKLEELEARAAAGEDGGGSSAGEDDEISTGR